MRRREQGSERFLQLVVLSSFVVLLASDGVAQEPTAPPEAEAQPSKAADPVEEKEVLSEEEFEEVTEEAVEVEEPSPSDPEEASEEPAEPSPKPEAEPPPSAEVAPTEPEEVHSEQTLRELTDEAVEVEQPPPEAPVAEEGAEPPPRAPEAEPEPSAEVAPTEPERVHSEETFRDVTEEAVEVAEEPSAPVPAAEPSPPAEKPAAVKPEAQPEPEPARAPREEPARAEAVDPAARTVTFNRGIRIQRNDLQYRIKLGGRMMYDVAWIHGGKEVSSQFKTGFFNELRRGWTELTGTYGSRILYRIQVDMEGDSGRGEGRNRYFRQTFVAYTAPGSLRGVWVGMFKEPFTIGEGTGSLVTTFMERSLPQAFFTSYNLGIMLKN